MTVETRNEYTEILRSRYKEASSRKEKSEILDEYVVNTGVRRKSAIRALNRRKFRYRKRKTGRKVQYTYDLRKPLKIIWQCSNKACSKNLKPEIPNLIKKLKQFNEIELLPGHEEKIKKMGTFTIDRLLRSSRKATKGISGTCKSPHLKKLIPIRTNFDENVVVGDLELDCVLHCGDSVAGQYAETLNMVDIKTLWSERRIFFKKTKTKVIGALHESIKNQFPFPICSIDFDNGFEFVNYAMVGYCKKQGLDFTRSRSYHKNDQAHVEERNGHIVRGVIGYDRIEDARIVALIADIYANELRLLSNYFWPVRKLVYKEKRNGTYTKRYDKARTPYTRVLESKKVSKQNKFRLIEEYTELNPMALKRSLDKKLGKLKRLLR